jgi:hypothetical protein
MSGAHEVSKARLKYPNGDRFSSCHKPSMMTMMIDLVARAKLDQPETGDVRYPGSTIAL